MGTAQVSVSEQDAALLEVAAEIKRLDPTGAKVAAVVRHTYDGIYSGAETGRYRFDQLMKTEKTHFGTLFEINMQRAFGFVGGDKTDYRIAGHEVDAKWSMSDGGWMLPPEVFGEIALIATGADAVTAQFSLGLVRVKNEYRRPGTNRDAKTSLNSIGRSAIHWLWKDQPFPASVLLQLPQPVVDDILRLSYGTKRIDALFRAAEGRLVHRNVVRTVARQLDDQKRVRANGGARTALRDEGYLILSGRYADLAEDLGLPRPSAVQYISVRVVPAAGDHGTEIDGRRWRVAGANEICSAAAPILPKVGSSPPTPAGRADITFLDLWAGVTMRPATSVKSARRA